MSDVLCTLLEDHGELERRIDVFDEDIRNHGDADPRRIAALDWVLDFLSTTTLDATTGERTRSFAGFTGLIRRWVGKVTLPNWKPSTNSWPDERATSPPPFTCSPRRNPQRRRG